MKPFLDDLSAGLDGIRASGLERILREPRGIDFSSNDYLGLSRHPSLRRRLLERLERDEGPLGAPARTI